jgi:hypothetical protein
VDWWWALSSRAKAALLLFALLAACNSLVDPSGPSGIKQLGPEGGTVTSDLGVKLWLPPGALAQDTTVMITVMSAPMEGVERAVELEPLDLPLALPAVLTFTSPASDRPKIGRYAGTAGFRALPGRRLDPSAISAPIMSLGLFGVLASREQCSGGADEDGDGLVDCSDPVCAGDVACGLACATNADCACGSTCVGGGCSAPNPRFCAAAGDCSGVPCSTPMSRGTACGFTMCAVDASDGGTTQTVAACSTEVDECACAACAGTNQCPLGTTCQPATHHNGQQLCGINVCL